MNYQGLSNEEVTKLREKYGYNEINEEKKDTFIKKVFKILCEPMFILLIITALIYFILGEPKDGFIMLIFVVVIIFIDIIQEFKTDKTLESLKKLSEPTVKVIRNGVEETINSKYLVPGDLIMIKEGERIPADGYILKCNGLKVDESMLTGESTHIYKTTKKDTKNTHFREDYCYQGTLVIQGTGIIKVNAIGSKTEYGKIGNNLMNITTNKSPLERQIDKLIKYCAIIAAILLFLVTTFTFILLSDIALKERIIKSILSGLTLAMAMIPEEFPVVLTIFLSLGAWRLAKKNSLVKKTSSIETLGAISVLCVDKTGTITKNQMEVKETYNYNTSDFDLIMNMCLSSYEETYDPMEKAIFRYAHDRGIYKKEIFKNKKIKEYPFDNENKIMGSCYKIKNKYLVSVKGSIENILKYSKINDDEINKKVNEMQEKGLRVIGICSIVLNNENEIKDNLEDYNLTFNGFIGLIDPPKDNIEVDLNRCLNAGIRVVMITGDNGTTASAIAKKIGLPNTDKIITGDMIDKMTFEELKEKVKDVTIFSRVIPEHKMQIVRALQSNGEVVAMTGDGVNDAPALKKADIGIAMGNMGEYVSREAADLVLLDDNFSTIIDTIKDGRRIYDNIKKAIGYILVIHIPIALASLLPPLLGISTNNLMLLPIHIVLLELIIDPTCSIVLERQPEEMNIMTRKPRKISGNIVTKNLLTKSIIQGIIIFISAFTLYIMNIDSISIARTMSLLTIAISNMFLVIVNSSSIDYAYITIKKLVKDKIFITMNLIFILSIILITYTKINTIFKLTSLSFTNLIIVIFISFISVFWYEIVKLLKNKYEN